MKWLTAATEDDIVCAFVRAEVDSPDARAHIIPHVLAAGFQPEEFKAALVSAGARTEAVLRVARTALSFRGYGKNAFLFEGFPADVQWSRVALEPDDFVTMRYGRERSWLDFAASRFVRDGATAVLRGSTNGHAIKAARIAEDMKAGKKFDEIILVHKGDGQLVLLEGWHRATAYAVCGVVDAVPAYVGASGQLGSWIWL